MRDWITDIKADIFSILFRAHNFIIKSITRSLIIFKKPRKITNDFFNHCIFVIEEYIVIEEIISHLSRFLKND